MNEKDWIGDWNGCNFLNEHFTHANAIEIRYASSQNEIRLHKWDERQRINGRKNEMQTQSDDFDSIHKVWSDAEQILFIRTDEAIGKSLLYKMGMNHIEKLKHVWKSF